MGMNVLCKRIKSVLIFNLTGTLLLCSPVLRKKKLYIQVLHREARQYDNNTLRLVHLSIDNCYIYNKTGEKN